MGLLGITFNTFNQIEAPRTQRTTSTDSQVSIMTAARRTSTTAASQDKEHDEFYNALENSPVKGKMLHGNDLKLRGFKEAEIFGKNGDHYYSKGDEGYVINEDRFRVEGNPEAKSVEYKNPNMSHYSTFDEKGNELGGVIKLRQVDGSIRVYNYEVDVDGNRFIKSITTTKEDSDFNTNSSSASLNELRKYRALAQTQRPDDYAAVAFSRFKKTLARLFLPSTFSKSSNIPEENTQA